MLELLNQTRKVHFLNSYELYVLPLLNSITSHRQTLTTCHRNTTRPHPNLCFCALLDYNQPNCLRPLTATQSHYNFSFYIDTLILFLIISKCK